MAACQPVNPAVQVVLAEEQQSILQRVNEEIPQERIYFSVNLAENRIAHCNGVPVG